MKEPYVEGVALHHGLESCANLPRGGREALTEADAGWVLSHEIFDIGIADLVPRKGRQHAEGRQARVQGRVPGVVDPMHASKLLMRKLGELGSILQQRHGCRIGRGKRESIIPTCTLPSSQTVE